MTPDFRALCAELLVAIQLYTGLNPAASEMSSVEKTEKLMDAMAATAATLTTPPPEPPTEQKNSIDELIAGCKPLDPEMEEVLTTEARWRLFGEQDSATPPPELPTYEELQEWVNATLGADVGDPQEFGWGRHCFTKKQFARAIRAALERWGHG